MIEKSKKALFIIGVPGFSFRNENSAVAKYLLLLSDALTEQGFQVTLLPFSDGAGLLTTHKSSTGNSMTSKLKKAFRKFAPYLYNTLADHRYYKAQELIYREAERIVADADIIIEFLTYGSSIGARLKARSKKSLVLIYDSPLEHQYIEMHPAGSMYLKRIGKAEAFSVEHADHLICYSDPVRKYVQSSYNVKCDISIMPCIVWKGISLPYENERRKYVGFIGSFLVWHKVELLLKSFETIGSEFPGINLLLLGYGGEWERIHQLAMNHPYSSRIIMPGFVNEEELTEYKKQIAVGVMPGTNWYGSPLKLFEYAEAGIPVIAPSSPSVKDLFRKDHEALFIDPDNESGSLTSSLRKLLSDPSLREKLTANAYEKMKGEFGKARQTSIFTEIISNTINRGIKK